MIVGMLAILAMWLALFCLFAGLGLWVVRLAALDGAVEPVTAFWLGLAAATLLLQAWHLLAPVGAAALIFLGVIAGAGLALHAPPLVRRMRAGVRLRSARLLLPLAALFSLWLANRAMGSLAGSGDAGLYHIGAVHWNHSYPLVPGLGNLHGRFAFNNANFLLLAMLEVGPWTQASHHLVSGLLILVLVLWLGAGLSVFFGGGCLRGSDLLRVMLLGLALRSAFFYAVSTSPDLPIYICGIVGGVTLYRLLFEAVDLDETGRLALVVLALGAFGTAVKLSFAAFAAVSSALALCWWLYQAGEEQAWGAVRRPLAVGIGLAGLILLFWLVRGVLLSGYLVYPSTWLAFPVPWRVAEAQAIDEARWIVAWARQPGVLHSEVLADWGWLRLWLAEALRQVHSFTLPLALFAAGGALLIWRHRHRPSFLGKALLFLSAPAAGALFWWATAPSLRFVGASLWLLGAGALVLGMEGMAALKLKAAAVAVALCAAPTLINLAGESGWVTAPGSGRWGLHPLPQPALTEFVTRSGLLLYVPSEGVSCWYAPLPCTPYPSEAVTLLEAGQLESGFARHEERPQIRWPDAQE